MENEWNGQGQGYRDTVSYVIYADTLLSNGKTYFRIEPYSWYLKDFIRSDSIGIYYYDFVNEQEWMFYQYDLEVSTDVYPYGPYLEVGYERNAADTNDYFKIYKWIEGKTSKFGDSIQVYTYNCDVDSDNGYQVSVSPKIGFFGVHATSFFSNFDMELLACKINSITYGNLTAVKEIKQLGSAFYLYQNYPNPFNPTTTISFTIPDVVRQHAVSLHVYDLLGRKIATPIDRKNLYGYHEVEFDASNISSGIYFYKLIVGSYSLIKKMLLVK